MVDVSQTTCGNYILFEELGSGVSGQVYRGLLNKTKKENDGQSGRENEYVAVKVMKIDVDTKQEVEVMNALTKRVSNEGVSNETKEEKRDLDPRERLIGFIEYQSNVALERPSFSNLERKIIVLELCPNRAVISYLIVQELKEGIARFYFRQLIEGLEYMHEAGYAHLDLKPDNLLLDRKMNLKISDFGASRKFKEDGNQIFFGGDLHFGTKRYNAPEYHTRDERPIAGEPFDIFSCGCILFIMMFHLNPLRKSSKKKDLIFSNVIYGDWEKYWKSRKAAYKVNVKEDTKIFKDEDLRELLQGMLEPDPKKRFTISKIKDSIWYKKEIPALSEVHVEMKKIRKVFCPNLDSESGVGRTRGLRDKDFDKIKENLEGVYENFENDREIREYRGGLGNSPQEIPVDIEVKDAFVLIIDAARKFKDSKITLEKEEYEINVESVIDEQKLITKFSIFKMDNKNSIIIATKQKGDILNMGLFIRHIQQHFTNLSDEEN